MKLKSSLFLVVLIYFATPVSAQQKLIDSSINASKTNAEKHVIDGVSGKVNSGIDNVLNGSIFKRKSKPGKERVSYTDDGPSPAPTIEKGKTEITVSNATYASLGTLAEALNSDRLVTNVEKTFSNGMGVLKVSHTGSSDQLLDDIVKKAGDKFDVGDLSEGRITLKMK